MLKPRTLIVLLAFLLINFLELFLCNHLQDSLTKTYLIWANTNIAYLITLMSILSRYLNSGVIEQVIIIFKKTQIMIIKIIFEFWFRIGIPLASLSSVIYCISSSTNEMLTQKTAFFFISILYSTLLLTAMGAMCNCLTNSRAHLTTLILSIPLSVPAIVTAALIISEPAQNLRLFIGMSVCNVILSIGSLLLTNFIIHQIVEES